MAGPSEIVSGLWGTAVSNAAGFAGNASGRLSSAAASGGTSAPQVTAAEYYFSPDVVEPNVDIPTTARAAGFEAFRSIWEETIADLSGRFTDFIREYFPDETPYINDAQAWISHAISEGGTGLAPHIEAQIWERDRARLMREADRAEQEVIGSWAARGFPMPNGAAVHAVSMVRQDTREKIADASAKVAIEQAQLEQKNTQFAVENAIKLWTSAMQAAGEYIKAIAVGPNAAGVIIPSVTDSQSRLISAAADYYRARISVQELKMKAGQIPAQWFQEANLKNGDLKEEWIKTQVQAASEAARVYGLMASASINSLHASANISGSDSLNFNYSGEASGPMSP